MKIIFFIFIGISLLQADFVKSGNTLRDTKSNLEWQDNEIGSKTFWEGAIFHCENLDLDGKTDWRLPNINELKSIVDRTKSSPAIVSAFTNTNAAIYYSSTTYDDDRTASWLVDFKNGSSFEYTKSSQYNVRCVRGGK